LLRYIVRRVLWGIALLIIVSAVVFILFYVFPSADPAKLRAGRTANPQLVEQIRQQLHLDDPIYVQFWDYMKNVFLHFDFGRSYQSNTDVRATILDRLPATALLVAGSAVIWLAIGLPVGIISAVKRRSLLDRTTMVTTLAFISAPVFWLGLVALYLFASDVGKLNDVPPFGIDLAIFPGIGSYLSADTFLAKCGSMLLPWFVLAAATAAIYARYLRSSMIDTMSEDYIRTARAKGLPERDVVIRHGVRSAITPIVTLLGLDVGLLLAGNAILTETVFNIPGVGREIVVAINRSDLPLIQGIVLFGAFFIVLFNLIVDIAYAYLDPRVRYQ
jgi:peptide/nickel transport system permease protein